MKPATIKHYEERFKEGKMLYLVKVKEPVESIDTVAAHPSIDTDPVVAAHPLRVESSASVLDDIIVCPNPPANRKGKSISDMPKHLTGDQMFHYFEEKRLNKERLEEEKARKKGK